MNAKLKIRLEAIEQAQRALDALPQHRPEELTKTEAIQRLIVPIRATQSKGYSLVAIGKVLSESGIPITTGALRAYVSEARAVARGKGKAKGKRGDKAPPMTMLGGAKGSQKTSSTQRTEPATKPANAKPTESTAEQAGAGDARNIELDWDPAAPSEKVVRERSAVPRRGFEVREDTKDT
jgi:hypothetical protein